MTGEMFKPEGANKGESFWEGKRSAMGYSVIGDDAFLIRPNYPEFFELKDKIRRVGFRDASVQPFDVYQGPYIDLKGVDVGRGPYERGAMSVAISRAIGSCQVRRAEMGMWSIDCGVNNKKLWGVDEAFIGDKETIIDALKDIKGELG